MKSQLEFFKERPKMPDKQVKDSSLKDIKKKEKPLEEEQLQLSLPPEESKPIIVMGKDGRVDWYGDRHP